MDGKELKKISDQFDKEMMNVYNYALKKCNYKASRFLQMFLEYKGVTTAKMLRLIGVRLENCYLDIMYPL